jgi:hypothetical protein
MAKKGTKQRISGLVDAFGASGGQPGGKGPWRLSFTLEAWRDAKGKLHQSKLGVEKAVTSRALDTLMDAVASNAILSFEVIVSGEHDAELVKVLGPLKVEDAELEAIQRELTRPKKVKVAPFGTLKFDRALGWYSGRAKWGGRMVDLHLSGDEDDVESALEVARKLFKAQVRWTRRVRDYAVQELLELKNQNWLKKGERELTAKQFKGRMKLESITVDDDGEFTFLHADGGLFWGHSIQIGGDLKAGPNDADIPG